MRGLRLRICIVGEGPLNSMGLIHEHRNLGLMFGKKGEKVLDNGNFCSELVTYVHKFLNFWTLQIQEGNLVVDFNVFHGPRMELSVCNKLLQI